MKISDFIFGPELGNFRHPASCRVRIFIVHDTRVVVVLTDLDDLGVGSSVTNSVEHLWAALLHIGLVTTNAILIEHYEEISGGQTFDSVTFRSDGSPVWKPLPFEDAIVFLGCEDNEFLLRTRDIPRLYHAARRLRQAGDPFSDSPDPERTEVVKRRLVLEAEMLPKTELQSLIEQGSRERDLQRLLKRDLSFFGEAYGNPREQYICFREFPLGQGFVDFVVFTGTSRMEVIFIEIKGAGFDLLKRTGHLSARINDAAGQLRTRVGHVYRGYEEFRRNVHRIRAEVERGNRIYGAIAGPKIPLLVDPQKDVVIRSVLIGGRSRDDYKESRVRHDFEVTSTPSVRVESWDSWTKKLRRE